MAIAEARRAPGQESVITGRGVFRTATDSFRSGYTRHYYGFKSHYPIQHFKSYTVEVIELFLIGYVPAETMA